MSLSVKETTESHRRPVIMVVDGESYERVAKEGNASLTGGSVCHSVRIFVILSMEMCFSSGFEVKKDSYRMTSPPITEVLREEVFFDLQQRDLLFIYTDGLNEAEYRN